MKRAVKSLLRMICLIVASPAALACKLEGVTGSRDRSFAGWTQVFSLIPGRPGEFLRHAFLRLAARSCGDDVSVGFATIFSHAHVSLGHRTYVGHHCSIGDVAIGDDVLIASHVSIMNGCHQHGTECLDVPIRDQPGNYIPITIGAGSWIGERATVAASIGSHSVVGAGAVVLEPVPDFCVVAGVPARILRDRRAPGAVSAVDAKQAGIRQRTSVPDIRVPTN